MSAQLALRPYQIGALDALSTGWKDGGFLRQAVVLPTGTGKTVVFSHLIDREHRTGRRTLVLVHREELAEQAAEKISAIAPGLTTGVVKANRNETGADVVIGSVQTLARPSRREQIKDVDLVVVDECHHAAARTWTDVLRHYGAWEYTRVAGFTATMARDDGKHLGDIWQKIAFDMDIRDAIMDGYLTDVEGKQITVDGLDLASVARSRGDFADGSLGDALEASGAGDVVAKAYLEHAAGRPGVLFAPTVSSARAFADAFNAAGITTEVVVGTTTGDERAEIYGRYRKGATQVLASVGVLTEGWDAPWCEVAVVARPTSSAPLYQQMVGRILRRHPGKGAALVLDVVGVSGRHKLRSLIDLSTSPGVGEVLPGETLGGAIARGEKERGSMPAGKIVGVLGAEAVDLFADSSSVWLQTYAGVWFVPVRDGVYFLWPERAGTWKVGRSSNRRGTGTWLHHGLDLGLAMALGEDAAKQEDPSVSSKSSSWRTRRGDPSPAQLQVAARVGLTIPQGSSKADVSNLLSTHFASRLLDPIR
jgi:superfamily II DNA or RNA helicase